MGPENKIEFGSGTLYIDGIEYGPATIEDSSILELSPIDHEILDKIRSLQSVEFTGTCKISFRGMWKLCGFWFAVKWKARELWRMLRMPIEED